MQFSPGAHAWPSDLVPSFRDRYHVTFEWVPRVIPEGSPSGFWQRVVCGPVDPDDLLMSWTRDC